jgi:hypothetical protein
MTWVELRGPEPLTPTLPGRLGDVRTCPPKVVSQVTATDDVSRPDGPASSPITDENRRTPDL